MGPWGSARDPRASGPQRAPNDTRRPQNRKAGPEQTWTSVDPRLLRSMIRVALNTGPLLHYTARARCASTQRGQHRCTARLGGVRRTDNGRHGLFGCVLRLYDRQRCRGFRRGCRRHVRDIDAVDVTEGACIIVGVPARHLSAEVSRLSQNGYGDPRVICLHMGVAPTGGCRTKRGNPGFGKFSSRPGPPRPLKSKTFTLCLAPLLVPPCEGK